ncbi:DUF3558 domain-containing protein [Nocardia sp. CA-290969]|uniref:DUF3558 domain-containing protein n=1 Tax=Nocardia sp. CA-290969 TaxID=3239986 RepID=UPI003D8B4D00
MLLRKGMKLAAALAVAGFLATGCDSAGGSAESTPASTGTLTPLGLQPEAPTSYDPCVGVTQDILDQLQLRAATKPNTADFDGPGGTKWRGCKWVRTNGYAISVTVSNLTFEYIRDRWSDTLEELTIAGRPATSVRKSNDDESCSINVEMQGGSLEFHIVNPPSGSDTGHQNTCQLGVEVAELVVPTMPAQA